MPPLNCLPLFQQGPLLFQDDPLGLQQSALLVAVIGDFGQALPPVGHHQREQCADAA